MTKHGWFTSTTGLTVTSHNGTASEGVRPGTLAAFTRAYADRYRWFQIDVVPCQDNLLSAHAVFGRRWGWRNRSFPDLQRMQPDLVTLDDVVRHPGMSDARWNIEMKSASGQDCLRETFRRLQADGFELTDLGRTRQSVSHGPSRPPRPCDE